MHNDINSNQKSLHQKRSSIIKILIVLWLLVIAGVIILVKETPLVETLSGFGALPKSTLDQEIVKIPDAKILENTRGAIATPELESAQATAYSQASESPSDRYKLAIANRKPTLVFFHSTTCKSCLQMIDTVYEIYPEFSSQVVLIDVDVYDAKNENLINRVGINYIPTLVFYDQNGGSLFSIGVISNEELRQKLTVLSLGKLP